MITKKKPIKLLLFLVIFSSKQVCAVDANRFAHLFHDKGLCEGETWKIDIASTVAELEQRLQMRSLEFYSGFPVGYNNEVARYVFNKSFRETMEEMSSSDNTKIFVILCICVPMSIGINWLFDNKKRVKKFINKYYILTKQYAKQKYFFFKRLLFDTDIAKFLKLNYYEN